MNGKIYVVKNKINGKYYVGQTVQNINERKNQHKSDKRGCGIFHSAISKYGIDNFEWHIIEENIDDQELLNMLERLYIAKYESNYKYWGYNIKDGGSNGIMGEITKEKLSIINSGNKNPFFGKQKSKYRGTNFKKTERNIKSPWNKVWRCIIKYNKRNISLGYFHDPISSEIVYNFVFNEIYG